MARLPFVDAALTNTYWRLTVLNGKGIVRTQPAKREAHLIFIMQMMGRQGYQALQGATVF